MRLSVLYTPEAKETLLIIRERINEKFGVRSAEKFTAQAANIISLITMQPFMYKATEVDEYVRVGLVTKQCSLIYRVTDTEIHLLYFWDNRQEPILSLQNKN